ncbi:MAG: hypothetical protein K2G03_02935, partial [Bacilli bacterium]|nr:hypothetical protein [Bacilli bacterium]
MKTLRKKILIASIILIAVLYIPDHQYKNIDVQEINYENDNVRVFSYSLGRVFIGDYHTIKKMTKNADENDIFIIDYRQIEDPDMQVLNSYRIK